MTDILKRLRSGAVIATDQLIGALHTDAADEIERLRADFDPPICRLQFPDGSVPGNLLEAAEGWKRRYEERAAGSHLARPEGEPK